MYLLFIHLSTDLFIPAHLVIQHSSKILSGRNQQFLIPNLMKFYCLFWLLSLVFFLPTTADKALWNFILFLGKVFNLSKSLSILNLSPVVLAVFFILDEHWMKPCGEECSQREISKKLTLYRSSITHIF